MRKFEHVPKLVYIHFKTNAAMTVSPTLHGYRRHPTKQTIEPTPGAITSSDVMCVLTLWILTTPTSRDWSRDMKSFSETIQCYSYFHCLPRAKNLVFIADETCPLERRLSSSNHMSQDPWSHFIHFPTTAVRTQCSTLWAVIVSQKCFHFCFYFQLFLRVMFSL